eukprot:g8097.t1
MPAAGVVGGLIEKGWDPRNLAFFDGMPKREVKGILAGLADRWQESDFIELYREAKRQRRRLDLEDNVFLTHQRLLFRDKSIVDRQLAKLPMWEAQAGTPMELARRLMPKATWTTRLHRLEAKVTGDNQREKLEQAERDRWVRELNDLLHEAGYLGRQDKEFEAMQYVATRYAMGRRAATIRQHVRHGRRIQEYMEGVYGVQEVNMEVMNMEVVAPQILVQILGAITGKVKGTILVNVMGTAVVEADLVKRGEKLREAFWEEVTAFVDGMSKKERLTLMAELALGRHSSSPFGGKTDEIRGRLGEKVRELGLEPGRKGGDRDTEIAFRRLKAWSELLDNGDWRLERPGEELRENYLSAQEHMGKVKEHVEKDVKKGCLDVRCCF